MYAVVRKSFITYDMLRHKGERTPYIPPDPGEPIEPVEKKPLIMITFDDGIHSDYRIAFPEMTARGLKGTSYINVGRMDEESRMTWENIHEMVDSEMWDVQCHSYTHPNLTTLTEQEIMEQMENTNAAFIANGLEAPKHHAYPFGASNNLVRDTIKNYRVTQRTTNYRHTNINYYDSFNMNYVRSITGDTNDDEKLQFIKDAINYTISEKGILSIYLHQIVPNIGTYASQTARVYFDQIIDYVAQKQDNEEIESVTISEAVERVKAYQQQGG